MLDALSFVAPWRRPARDLPMTSLSDIELRTIDGKPETFGARAGKATLVVNVASRCGFTPQYAGLEKLHRRYSNQGLAVMGFPCDQFGHQEPGDEAEIQKFCSLTYDVTFPMFAKVEVNGENAHPLFKALKAAAPGLIGTSFIKWNFTKFLIDKQGKVVNRYGPAERPESIAKDIEPLLR
jgi:glutathione peroxidase